MPKIQTRAQMDARKAKAERFVRDVLEDDERAEEIAGESVEAYAERRGFEIQNPGGGSFRILLIPTNAGRKSGGAKRAMAKETREQLAARLAELAEENNALRDENEDLQGRLDRITSVATGEELDEDEDDGEEYDDEEDDGEEYDDEEEE